MEYINLRLNWTQLMIIRNSLESDIETLLDMEDPTEEETTELIQRVHLLHDVSIALHDLMKPQGGENK